MSGHERQRLSAYLDGELPASEHADVSAHLAACPECAAFLADLAAVDAEAASLPAAAPDGYFERFPSRVVARLEGTGTARLRRWRPPVWTWAAAAALLLAVVTPLTLREKRAEVAPAKAADALAQAPAAPELGATGGRGAAPTTLAPTPTPLPRPASAPFAAPPSSVGENRAARAQRASAAEREKRGERDEAPSAPLVTAGATPAGVVPDDARRERAVREEAFVDASVAAEAEAGPPPPARTTAVPAAASVESVAPAPGREQGPMGKAAPVDEAGRAFRRLDAVRPVAAADWRRLREGWLAFAAAHPGDRRADEARVRAIEASREAWLAGGEPADEEEFRRDAAAYLSALESLQKPRVERLLAEPRPAP